MQVVTAKKVPINRWDKDSIRPGPVGSVGDVNLQVQLKKSSNDLPNRYDYIFSGKNEVWSGSNVSDGQWYGFTSGGRGAKVISSQIPNFTDGNKTAVGWRFQNIKPTDRTRETKMTPLGQYGWETTVASVLKAKVGGEGFLPLPGGYEKTKLPRGSQNPRVVAESIGAGEILPAADVEITNPIFGETGTISVPVPGSNTCEELKQDYTWVPAENDPLRSVPPPKQYPYRKAWIRDGQKYYSETSWPDIGDKSLVADIDHGYTLFELKADPCGARLRQFAKDRPYETRPMPGNQDKRNRDKKKEMEDEKKKKQKLR